LVRQKIIKSIEQIISELGEPPICGCDECQKNGTRVNIFPRYYNKYKLKGYPKFIVRHNNIGKPAWNKNIPASEETRSKQSESAKRRYRLNPEKHPMLGKHHTIESNLKNSESHIGSIPWNKDTKGMCVPNSGSFQPDQSPWNKSLTKETDERVKQGAENNSESHIGKINDGCGNNFGTGDYHLTPNQGIVWMRSSWEILYAIYLESNNIDYYYELYAFEMIINDKLTTYRPDFFLPTQNKFVEIKGYFRDEISKQKSDKF
jgi:hypothetical protein